MLFGQGKAGPGLNRIPELFDSFFDFEPRYPAPTPFLFEVLQEGRTPLKLIDIITLISLHCQPYL
jgi:hypothetical protein